MIHYVCNKDTIHNGTQYRKGQCWDGDPPAPSVGVDWSILQVNDTEGPREGIAASASRGFVRWKEQPDRPRAAPPTPEEKAILAENPYANIDGPVEVAPPSSATRDPLPTCREKKQEVPILSAHLLMTQEEIDDPFGLRARAAATTAELKEDSPVDPPHPLHQNPKMKII